MKLPFWLSLGSCSKQASDEADLPGDVSFAHTSELSLAHHIHDLVSRHAFALPFQGKRSPSLA